MTTDIGTEADLLFGSAGDAAAAILRRDISSRELTQLLFDRIDAANPAVNAVVELDRDTALSAARMADEKTVRPGSLGPLHGVPMTVKDSFDASGLHTTWGNPAYRDHVAAGDATVVRRLRDAGAVVVGKTNVHFMLADFGQTANELFGRTNNPWDTARSPGGSTGGGAAALAAGMTFLEYGSDLAGSIRIPASFCGVYGLKPTPELVPLGGFGPPGPPPLLSPMVSPAVLGPLGRSATDLRTALVATAGPVGPTALATSWTLPAPRHRRLADFRIGVVLDDPGAPPTAEVAAVLSDAVDALAGAGCSIVHGWPVGLDPAAGLDSFGFHIDLFFALQESAEPVDDSGGDAPFAALSDLFRQERTRLAVRDAWDRHFHRIDVWLCPANFTAAFPHDDRPFEERTIATAAGPRSYQEQTFWIAPASLAGLPAAVAPVGTTAAGLPVGLQIIAPRFEDDTAITFAELLAELIGGYRRPLA